MEAEPLYHGFETVEAAGLPDVPPGVAGWLFICTFDGTMLDQCNMKSLVQITEMFNLEDAVMFVTINGTEHQHVICEPYLSAHFRTLINEIETHTVIQSERLEAMLGEAGNAMWQQWGAGPRAAALKSVGGDLELVVEPNLPDILKTLIRDILKCPAPETPE